MPMCQFSMHESATLQGVAVCFSENEWAGLASIQRAPYSDVMPENYVAMAALGYPFLLGFPSRSGRQASKSEAADDPSLVCTKGVSKSGKEDSILENNF